MQALNNPNTLIYCNQDHELYFTCCKFIGVYEFSVESKYIIF